ncbi:MAG: alpha/beta hydrolase [Spirochaetales bacterium]|nr:alpha/beta hydrolase [Spirochaetales bacterium]
MPECMVELSEGHFHLRYTAVNQGKPRVLFIHGLGDSGLSFKEAFAAAELNDFSLFVPDLLGCGMSSAAVNNTYGMNARIKRLWKLIDRLGIDSFYIVAHSMGGDLAVVMADSDSKGKIKGLVNIEGNLTPHDLFISSNAVAAAEQGNFQEWFEQDFKEQTVLRQWGGSWVSCRRYYSSLQLCSPKVFLEDAKAIFEKNQPLSQNKGSSIGISYAGLKIPKIFCWGSASLGPGAKEFIAAELLDNKEFKHAFHWPMIDRARRFYSFIADFFLRIEGRRVIKD